MFEDDEQAQAMGVPLYYGIIEAIVLGLYCFIAWKMNWTKAPAGDPFCTVISTSYEVLYAERLELQEIEARRERKQVETEQMLETLSIEIENDGDESPKKFRRFRSTAKRLKSCFPKRLRAYIPRCRRASGPKEPSRYNIFLPQ